MDGAEFNGFTVQEVLGQRDLTFTEVAAVLARSIGLPGLRYQQLPYREHLEALVEAGIAADPASQFTEMARAFNEGRIRSEAGRTPFSSTPTSIEHFAVEFARQYAETSEPSSH